MPPKIYKSCKVPIPVETRCPGPIDDLTVRLVIEPWRGPAGEGPCTGPNVRARKPAVAEMLSRSSAPAVYSADTRVGNWFEETALAAESACALALRRAWGGSPLDRLPVQRSAPLPDHDHEEPMRFGWRVQLLAPEVEACSCEGAACKSKGLVLHAADIGAGIAAGVPLVGKAERRPNPLSLFMVCSAMGSDEKHGHPLLLGQPFTLRAAHCPPQPALYAAAHCPAPGAAPADRQPVHLTGVVDGRAVWMARSACPNACACSLPPTMEAWGGPVGLPGGQALALYNCATGRPLAVAPHGWMCSGAGPVCAACTTLYPVAPARVGPRNRWRLVCDATKH